MSVVKLTLPTVVSLASLILCSNHLSADVQFVAPGVAGSVTNLTVGADVYDVTFVGNVTHAAWANQLDFSGEDEAEAAVAALAAELNATGGVTSLRFTTGGGTFDFTVGQLWHTATATMLFGETLTLSGATWFLANPLPGGSNAPINGASPLAIDFTPVRPSPWTDLGMGLAGTAGQTPLLVGTGDLIPGNIATLTLSNALPGANVFLVAGFSDLYSDFMGGILVPEPDLLLGPFPVNGAGGFDFSSPWPAGLPSGFQLWWQEWVIDAGGPFGFAASNGVLSTSP